MADVGELSIQSSTDGYGSEILGVDLRQRSKPILVELTEALERRGAIVLRGQQLSLADFESFVGAFGEPEDHTQVRFTVPGHPKVMRLTNTMVDGQPVGAHNDGLGWHTDYAYRAEPVKYTFLYALQVPPKGSDTLLADTCAAYDAYAAEGRPSVDHLHLIHSYKHIMQSRPGGAAQLTPEILRENPDVVHPLVQSLPRIGRKSLWVSRGTTGVVEKPGPEGLKLIEDLINFTIADRFVHRHIWQAGDVLAWDNRRTLHRGTPFDDARHIRDLWRMWVKGERPI